ncbi:MAG: pseudouridine synthase [bacterium]
MAESGIILFHKPKSVVVSRRDELGRRTVYNLLPPWVLEDGWVPVGRLDRDTRGLLLLVKDGRLVERLTRPGGLKRTYEVWVRGHVTEEHLEKVHQGICSPVGTLRCLEIQILGMAGPKSHLRVVVDEGKNRHIRRLFGALLDERYGTALKVLDLKRVQFGSVCLDVASGQWRFLSLVEHENLLSRDRAEHDSSISRA